MAEVFLISDTHFGHSKILEFVESRKQLGKTVDEHDEALVERWNSVVRKHDTVWHLGDVLFGKASFRHLGRLNGIKKLVKGNHDSYNAFEYLKHFNDVQGAHKLDEFLLTHIPVHPGQKYRFKGNIHGHLHSSCIQDPFYFNVSCEQINYTPISLHMVKQWYRQQAHGPQ